MRVQFEHIAFISRFYQANCSGEMPQTLVGV
jgi:hypothetical protein